jgi:hypothetical protein
MRVGSIDIVTCPSCKAEQQQVSFESYFSSGKPHDGAPENPRYIKCPKCGVFFKTDGCITKGKPGFVKSYGTKTAFLDAEGCRGAIREGLFNGDEKDIDIMRCKLQRLIENQKG